MHLLGTSVLAFLLLPLAFSCESTKPKNIIFEDYKNIISKQLEYINLKIEETLNKSCDKKAVPAINSHLTRHIHTLSCNRLPKNVTGLLENELMTSLVTSLVTTVNMSLGCPCSRHQATQADWWSSTQSLRRKLCRLKHLITRIKEAYEQYNSAK